MGNRETNLTYSLAKIFAVILGSTPRPTGLEMPGFVKAGVGVWRSTEDVPAEVMSTKVDIPGSDVAASCVLSRVKDALSHCFLDNGHCCCHASFHQLANVVSLIGLRRTVCLLVRLPDTTAFRCGSHPGKNPTL